MPGQSCRVYFVQIHKDSNGTAASITRFSNDCGALPKSGVFVLPIEYTVDEQRNFVHAIVQGQVDDHQFLDYVSRFHADPRIKPGYRELVDCTTATPGTITPALFEQIASLDRERPDLLPRAKTALVVTGEEAFELARRYEAHAEMPVTVFSRLDVALIWLGLK